MKSTPWRLIASAAVVTVLAVLSVVSGCKNPDEFKPPEDTLVEPPLPPSATAPEESLLIIATEFPLYVAMRWAAVAGAEIYQVEVARAGDSALSHMIDTLFYVIGFLDDLRFGDYRWRVRASSGHWIGGYTGWSPYYHYGVDFQPFGPMLIRPIPAESIWVDTLPAPVLMEWGRARDETLYDLKISRDSVVYFDSSVNDSIFEYWVEETGHYFWQVRANSPHWQMPGRWASSDFYVVFRK